MVEKKRKTVEIVEDFDEEVEEVKEEGSKPKKIKSIKKETKVPSTIDFRNYLNVYEFNTTLPGSGEEITFRPITTGQLKKLLIYENETDPMIIEGALDDLISSCIVDEDFDINDLYLQDRFFLLIEIRKKSKGEKYSFQYKCPECDSQTLMSVDLDSLEIKRLPEDINDVVEIDDNISVRLTHLTRGMQTKAFNSVKKMKGLSDMQKMTESLVSSHAISIIGIITPDGEIEEPSLIDTKFLLNNISTDSYDKIREWFANNDFGIKFSTEISCVNCNKEETIDIPIENFFF